MSITPTVLADGRVRMVVDVENSEFIDTAENPSIAVEVDKNKATTIMQVESGQSVIIGGLTFQRTGQSTSGLPWLRHIPLLNIFTSHIRDSTVRQEVLIYVTPYVWSPDLATPFPLPESFGIKARDSGPTNLERLRR
jgi:type II secretory pathway component GspD/PulD (secretin)